MLVVAADDSVMPQTREHLEILRLLGLAGGVIVLTKCDLADPSWLDLVEDEVRSLVRGTILENAVVVRTSATTGQGSRNSKRHLIHLFECEGAAIGDVSDGDRPVVHGAGHGTVVTGTVASGTVTVGDESSAAGWLEPCGFAACIVMTGRSSRSAGAHGPQSTSPASITPRSSVDRSWLPLGF